MKKIFLTLFFVAIFIGASVDKKPKQFEVTFEVTYNSITLEKAAQLEKEFKERFGNACKVDIKIKPVAVIGDISINSCNLQWHADSTSGTIIAD